MWTNILILGVLFTTKQTCSQPLSLHFDSQKIEPTTLPNLHTNDTNPYLDNKVKEAESLQSQITNSSLNSLKPFKNISKTGDANDTQTAKHLSFPIEIKTNIDEENAFKKMGEINANEENVTGATQVTMKDEEIIQNQNSTDKTQTEHLIFDKGDITSELIIKLEGEVKEVVEGVINKSMSIFQNTLLRHFDYLEKDMKELAKRQVMQAVTNEQHHTISNRKLENNSVNQEVLNVTLMKSNITLQPNQKSQKTKKIMPPQNIKDQNNVNLQATPKKAGKENATNETKQESLEAEEVNKPSTNSDDKTNEKALPVQVHIKKPEQSTLMQKIVLLLPMTLAWFHW